VLAFESFRLRIGMKLKLNVLLKKKLKLAFLLKILLVNESILPKCFICIIVLPEYIN